MSMRNKFYIMILYNFIYEKCIVLLVFKSGLIDVVKMC